ncbi:MAG: hypothetical protein GY749_22140 [Desulfobacteraceae bacterium]|nr:hypothetical protein [Desulfobacteraceae bacterium]
MIYSRHSLGPGRVIRKTVIRKTGQAVFFHDPGCTDCENADELLDEMQKTFPYLRIDKYDLNTNAGIDLNESLCRRFNVSERHRMFTPSVFAGSGYLAGEDINCESLADLIRPDPNPHTPILNPHQSPKPPIPQKVRVQTEILKNVLEFLEAFWYIF